MKCIFTNEEVEIFVVFATNLGIEYATLHTGRDLNKACDVAEEQQKYKRARVYKQHSMSHHTLIGEYHRDEKTWSYNYNIHTGYTDSNSATWTTTASSTTWY
jgi:hypothetical protein